MKQRLAILLFLCASVLLAVAQQPQVRNTQFTSEPVGISLPAAVDRFLHSDQPRWIGYSVSALPQAHLSSCSDGTDVRNGCCGEYSLEEPNNHISNARQDPSTPADMYVLMRIDHKKIIKILPIGSGCRLNAGGIAFTWLTQVKPEESATFLGKTIETMRDGNSHLLDQALVTLALHATPVATQLLSDLAAPKQEFRLREKAAFWLGVERGHEGFVILQKLAREDPDSAFREKLTFDISQNSDPQATDELIRMAKSDTEAKVRGQAIFWLAQKAGKKATAAVSSAVDNDPELSVKKRAVFALSQLPKEDGVQKLIHVAETNPNPAIKKEAIFWLGQSGDARALEYIERLVKQ